ncbi:hypothetical protein H7J88_17150 [Mycolicibacterium flavescens]|uniref:Uncharacterized protein n=1 Tax=Mycolicibacterium flavescens TaxID=1776 RepID=A0A1E3RP03_MYCFV|nr:hypothetical protein [Mycolicibacterium flavescens]MCV7281367.1 hypothetical protein [Mycolicibacterium flavescens]ODQ91127.1 hypothetical protein BHQ18_06945 [Mycolicibacterium flavescens]
MARLLTGKITVHGTDHEDFGANEHPTDNVRQVGPLIMHPGQGFIDLGKPTVSWGGECRVEVDLEAHLTDLNDAIRVHGWAYFFEGASEHTNELEDHREFDFHVNRTTGTSPETTFSVPLRNSTVVGAEDHAEVFFALSNRIVEEE